MDKISPLQRIAGELSASKAKADIALVKEGTVIKAQTGFKDDHFQVESGSLRRAFSETASEIRESLRREKR